MEIQKEMLSNLLIAFFAASANLVTSSPSDFNDVTGETIRRFPGAWSVTMRVVDLDADEST